MSLLAQDRSIKTTYVHTDGAVSLACSPDARYLYSGGADGIRCFDLTQSIDAAKTIEYHKDPVTFLDCSVDFLASCSESGETVLHHHATSSEQTCLFKSLITRTSLPTRCIKFSPNQKKLAVCSDELTIKIIDAHEPLNCQLLTGHTKSVKSLCWSPDSTKLISSGCDGALRLWDLEKKNPSDEPKCLQVIDDIIPTITPESQQSIEAVWHPSGKYFIAPNRQSGLAMVIKSDFDNNWKFSRIVCLPDQRDQMTPITAFKFSQNGRYLATGYQDGMIIVWSTPTWISEAHIQPEVGSSITAIQWRSQANSIVAANDLGQVITWQDVVPSSRPPPFNASSLDALESTHEDVGDASFQDDLDTYDRGINYDDEDWVIDDINQGRNSSKAVYTKGSFNHKLSTRNQLIPSHLSLTHNQEPFQPGATILRHGSSPDSKLGRRYLAFNSLGLVHVLEKEDENIVTVEFHDKGLHNGYHFTDSFKFNLSSIGNLGIAFACSLTKSNPSVIRYDPFESWATSGVAFKGSEQIGTDEEASWQFELPKGESAVAIACGGCANDEGKMENDGLAGSGTVVVGTNKGYVRLFSGSGIQTYIWNLGQQIISLACSSEFLLVVYRSSIAPQTHPLRYTLMDTSTFEIVQEGSIPLANTGVVLTWIGFSHPHSIPASFDSSGVLSFMDKARRPRQGRWVPMLSTSTLKTEGQLDRVYWPVGVSGTELSCIILKGGEIQPSIPAPLVQEVSLQMPLLELDSPQGQLEESFLRGSLLRNHQTDLANPQDYSLVSQLSVDQLELEKKLLKLLEICCKSEPGPSLQKALDYATELKNQNTLEAAAKICKFFNLAGLSDRISKLREARQLENDLTDQSALGKRKSKYAHLEDYDIITTPKPVSNRKINNSNLDLFEKPFAELPTNSTVGESRLFNYTSVFKEPPPSRKAVQPASEGERPDYKDGDYEDLDSTLGGEVTTDSFMHDVDEFSDIGGGPKRSKLSEYSLTNQVENATKPSTNPFAKKAFKVPSTNESTHQRSSNGENLFSAKKPSMITTTPELKKSGKFFDRVTPNQKGKGKVKQSTLLEFQSSKNNQKTRAEQERTIKKSKKSHQENADLDVPKPGHRFEKTDPEVSKFDQSKQFNEKINGDEEMREILHSHDLNPLNLDEDSQMSLTSIDFSQSLPPRIRSTLPPPEKSSQSSQPSAVLEPDSSINHSPSDHQDIGKQSSSKLELFRSKIK